jgi:hypothetical protein
VNLITNDIQAGVVVIHGHEARLVTKVVDGVATYCKFSAESGQPYGQQPAACMVKSLLTWADRVATPYEAAEYDQELILASCNQAAKEWVAGMLALMPAEFLSAELERRGILP